LKAHGEYSRQIQYNKTTALLVAAQTYRIFGIAFLWGMTQGLLDPAFAIPAGIGDILIGVTAIHSLFSYGRGIVGQSTP
jgi:hypothetical protein